MMIEQCLNYNVQFSALSFAPIWKVMFKYDMDLKFYIFVSPFSAVYAVRPLLYTTYYQWWETHSELNILWNHNFSMHTYLQQVLISLLVVFCATKNFWRCNDGKANLIVLLCRSWTNVYMYCAVKRFWSLYIVIHSLPQSSFGLVNLLASIVSCGIMNWSIYNLAKVEIVLSWLTQVTNIFLCIFWLLIDFNLVRYSLYSYTQYVRLEWTEY